MQIDWFSGRAGLDEFCCACLLLFFVHFDAIMVDTNEIPFGILISRPVSDIDSRIWILPAEIDQFHSLFWYHKQYSNSVDARWAKNGSVIANNNAKWTKKYAWISISIAVDPSIQGAPPRRSIPVYTLCVWEQQCAYNYVKYGKWIIFCARRYCLVRIESCGRSVDMRTSLYV